MSTSYKINAQTHDWELDADGHLVEVEDIIPEVILAVVMKRGLYHGDPNQGSDIYQALEGEPPANVNTFVEQAASQSLATLEAQSLATVNVISFTSPVLLIDIDQLPEPLTLSI